MHTDSNSLTAADIKNRLDQNGDGIEAENRFILRRIDAIANFIGASITILLKALADSTNLVIAIPLYVAALDETIKEGNTFNALVYTSAILGTADGIAKQLCLKYKNRAEIINNITIEHFTTAAVLKINFASAFNYDDSKSSILSFFLATYLTYKESNEYLNFTSRKEKLFGQIFSAAYRGFLLLTLLTVTQDINPDISIEDTTKRDVLYTYWAVDFVIHLLLSIFIQEDTLETINKWHNTILQFLEITLLSYEVCMQTAASTQDDDPSMTTFVLTGLLSIMLGLRLAYLQHIKENFLADCNEMAQRAQQTVNQYFAGAPTDEKQTENNTQSSSSRARDFFYGAAPKRSTSENSEKEPWRAYFYRSACETANGFTTGAQTAASRLWKTMRGN